jgi:DNA-binding winged helix-turn-helix (wHTH) protein
VSVPFCPCCGYDLVVNQPILLNDFSMMSPISPLTYRGEPIHLPPMQREICWSLMKACPDPVASTVVLDRVGSEGSHENVKVHIHYIRKALKEIGAPDPFKACFHRGGGAYKWLLKP